jgi:hypothetical protein
LPIPSGGVPAVRLVAPSQTESSRLRASQFKFAAQPAVKLAAPSKPSRKVLKLPVQSARKINLRLCAVNQILLKRLCKSVDACAKKSRTILAPSGRLPELQAAHAKARMTHDR